MSKSSKEEAAPVVGEPVLVLFGRDEKERPHAATFDAASAELAERAAGLMQMKVLRLTTPEHRAAASGLPAGRIFASGKAFAPFCREAAHEALSAFGEAFEPATPDDTHSPAPEVTHMPSSWSDIKPGSLVLAAMEPADPWYPAVVVEARDDDLFMLRWRDWPSWAGFVRRRDHLSLFGAAAATV